MVAVCLVSVVYGIWCSVGVRLCVLGVRSGAVELLDLGNGDLWWWGGLALGCV